MARPLSTIKAISSPRVSDVPLGRGCWPAVPGSESPASLQSAVPETDQGELICLRTWMRLFNPSLLSSPCQWSCCGAHGPDDWNLNIYFNCTDLNPSRERCGVPFSCCVKDPAVSPSGCLNQLFKLRQLTAPNKLYTKVFPNK